MRRLIFALMACITSTAFANSEPIAIAAWNVEDYDFGGREPASGSDGAIIATQLRDDFNGIDLFGLTEVHSEAAMEVYATMAAADEDFSYQYVFTRTGGWLRMGMMFNADRFTIVDSEELDFGLSPVRTRFPLAVTFNDTITDETFTAVLVHFARRAGDQRRLQAESLAAWAEQRDEPVIALGDFNFDFDTITGAHNDGYSALLDNGYFSWLEPTNRADTSWSGDTVDEYPNSILDFVFAGGEAQTWRFASYVYVRPGDFPDNSDTADHRPVVAVVQPVTGNAFEPDIELILPQLDLDERQMSSLSAGAARIERFAIGGENPLGPAPDAAVNFSLDAPSPSLAAGGSGVIGGGPTDEQLSRVNAAARAFQEALGGIGYLAPGTDPSTIDPELLPWVREAQRNRLLGDLNRLGYVAPGGDINDFPPGLRPYIRQGGAQFMIDGDNGR